MPGMRIPRVTAPSFCSARSRAPRRAAFVAAAMRSWRSSRSPPSATSGSIATETISCLPVTTTRTAPPPAVPSTVAAASSAWTRSMPACICCAILARLPMPIACSSAHLADVGSLADEDAASLIDQRAPIFVDREGGHVFDVRRHAAYPVGGAEDLADALLGDRPASLEGGRQEGLVLGEAEHDDPSFDGDGAARFDERPRGGVAADRGEDLAPAGAHVRDLPLGVAAAGRGRDRGRRRRRRDGCSPSSPRLLFDRRGGGGGAGCPPWAPGLLFDGRERGARRRSRFRPSLARRVSSGGRSFRGGDCDRGFRSRQRGPPPHALLPQPPH